MSLQPLLWFVGLFILVGLLFYTYRRFKQPPARLTCQYCGSSDLVEVRRDPVGSRTLETQSGNLGGGGDIRLQLDYKVTYHCNNCHKDTTLTVPQTF